MSEWKKYKLGDLADITSSKRIFYSDYVMEGIPFFRSKEIIERSLGESGGEPLYISREKFTEIKNNFGAPVDGDLLISAVGERAGIPYVVKNQGDFYFKDGNLIWLRNIKPELNSAYLYYWIKSSIGQYTLESIMIGSAQKALTIVGLKSLGVTLPSSAYQSLVVDILSSLDDKIDLLHRQNKSLEQLAETLFRQWFVEEVGESWEKGTVNSLIEIQSGFAFKSTDFVGEGNYKLITIKNVQDGYLDLSKTDFINEIPNRMPKYCLLQKGDILLSLTGNVGRCCLVTEENLFLNQRVAKLKARKNRDWAFAYIMFRQTSVRRMLEELAKGTAQANLSPIETANMEMQIPPNELLEEYTEEATPFLEKVLKNKKQINTLTQLRDSLLPKLMSGEVRIKN